MNRHRRDGTGKFTFMAIGAALMITLGSFATPAAEASSLKVKVSGGARRGVAVTIAGENLGTTVTKLTNGYGVAKFISVPGDTYTVAPLKFGYRFSPAAQFVSLPDGAIRSARFAVRPLPAVGSLNASTASLVLRKTLTATVEVTALDAAGSGIEGAPISAASDDTLAVKVEPATAVTDALGRAAFTISTFGAIGFSNPAMDGRPVVGGATVTFTSGGWRGTAVRTAETDVTVQQGLEAELWVASGHSDAAGEPFTHWDGDGSIEVRCARCHSKPGYLDYIADGTVDTPAALGTVVDCFLCHDPVSWAKTSVTFPSGAVVTGLGREAICSTCHQGRESSVSVDSKLAGKPLDDIDTGISFTNIHYYAAAATLFGGVAKGGYQYAGLPYDLRFPHVSALNACQECHDPHSLALKLDVCRTCHPGATDYDGVRDIRMAASTQDYDGDGDVTEGVAAEVDGLAAKLYETIQAYAAMKGNPIVYDGHTYPYFLYATGGGYKKFTPRLLKACYNYQVYQKDPGSHGHNAKYVIELLYDSIQDLASQLPGGTVAGLARNDLNHFDSSAEAFRHWDEDFPDPPAPQVPEVSASCSRCHGGEAGFLNYITTGTTIIVPPASRMSCETCHEGTDFAGAAPRRYVSQVTFPSPAADPTTINNDPVDPDDSFICITCHQGRESKKTIDVAIGVIGDDVEAASLKFKNVHYLSAGASLYGKQAGVGYEYPGKTYSLKFNHWGGDSSKCSYCHDVSSDSHSFLPRLTPVCGNCHTEITGGDIETIRYNRPYDYDGDGNTTEKLVDEIHGLRDILYAAIRSYAGGRATPITYSQTVYPYFFNDDNDNDVIDAGESGFNHWTPRLLKAAHNFQMAYKEPGDWAHNTNYTAQVMIDSVEDLGGDVSSFDRPVGY